MSSKEELFDNGIYIYKELELTPAIIAKLLTVFYSGKQFQRQDALKKVVDFHRENGGFLEKDNYIPSLKVALGRSLVDLATNKGYGVWYLKRENDTDNEQVITEDEEDDEDEDELEVQNVKQQYDKIIGDGDKAVYVYYYDTYKQYAILQGSSVWACKIGRTDVDPIQRVLGQASTSYPELPHIGLVIKCDNSSSLETTLHYILKVRGKWMENAPGTEWFITSPEEVESIYNSFFTSQK